MKELSTPASSVLPLSQKFCDWLKLRTFNDPQLVKLATQCQRWANAFKNSEAPRWLTIMGNSGTGKTHCARRLWNYAKERSNWSKMDFMPKVIYWPDFVQELRSGHAYEFRNELKRWPVLFLDDIGAERDPSGFASEEMHTLLGCRMNRWTLITSNKSPDALAAIDQRIFSRIIRGPNIAVNVNTQDYSAR